MLCLHKLRPASTLTRILHHPRSIPDLFLTGLSSLLYFRALPQLEMRNGRLVRPWLNKSVFFNPSHFVQPQSLCLNRLAPRGSQRWSSTSAPSADLPASTKIPLRRWSTPLAKTIADAIEVRLPLIQPLIQPVLTLPQGHRPNLHCSIYATVPDISGWRILHLFSTRCRCINRPFWSQRRLHNLS